MNEIETRLRRIENALGLAPINPPSTLDKVGIVVGHSRQGDDGAESVDGTSEYVYNCMVADALASLLAVPALVINDVPHDSYPAAMTWVARRLRATNCTLAVELHFNASGTGTATGHEYLFWHNSPNGKRLASELSAAHSAAWPADKNRGIKPKDAGDRGAHFLSKSHCPSVIAEPFFGDNPAQWSVYGAAHVPVAQMLAAGISRYVLR
jgi:N-acetylmuramoyl-L-alanine amidase